MTACLPRLPRLPRNTHCSPHCLTLVPAARHTAVQFAIPLGICLHVSAPVHATPVAHHIISHLSLSSTSRRWSSLSAAACL
jgi:hypothetical protein